MELSEAVRQLNEENKRNNAKISGKEYKVFDKTDYWSDKAMEYFLSDIPSAEEPSEEKMRQVYRAASVHMGFFMAWIIKHGFEADYPDEKRKAAQAVKAEKMSSAEFVIDFCGEAVTSEEFSDEIYTFVECYYKDEEGGYVKQYIRWVINELCDLPCEFTDSWEDYHDFEHIIDNAYNEYLKTV
ncbi:MAG: hypothetical protein IJ446_00505 [Oscillospiraceae bacterium]|nr:hypothetical protein [Oscillospiraceae bacterium]